MAVGQLLDVLQIILHLWWPPRGRDLQERQDLQGMETRQDNHIYYQSTHLYCHDAFRGSFSLVNIGEGNAISNPSTGWECGESLAPHIGWQVLLLIDSHSYSPLSPHNPPCVTRNRCGKTVWYQGADSNVSMTKKLYKIYFASLVAINSVITMKTQPVSWFLKLQSGAFWPDLLWHFVTTKNLKEGWRTPTSSIAVYRSGASFIKNVRKFMQEMKCLYK